MYYLDNDFPRLNDMVEMLNVVGKNARRCAANAKIGLCEGFLDRRFRDPEEKWVRVFDDVEPWSKDWLEWWEKYRKPDMISGEEANDTA